MNGWRLIGGFALIGLGVSMGLCVLYLIAFPNFFGMDDDPGTYWRATDTAKVLFVGSVAFVPGVWLVVSSIAGAREPREQIGSTAILIGTTTFVLVWLTADARDGLGSDVLLAVAAGGIPALLGAALLAHSSARRASPPSTRHAESPPPPGERQAAQDWETWGDARDFDWGA